MISRRLSHCSIDLEPFCPWDANFNSESMESILCDEHRVPCYLKTGLKDGPSKHKHFYVCSESALGCKFVKKASKIKNLAKCPHHQWRVVELQCLSHDGRTIHYRCPEGRNKGKPWCGRSELPAAVAPLVPNSAESDAIDSENQRNDVASVTNVQNHTSSAETSKSRVFTGQPLVSHDQRPRKESTASETLVKDRVKTPSSSLAEKMARMKLTSKDDSVAMSSSRDAVGVIKPKMAIKDDAESPAKSPRDGEKTQSSKNKDKKTAPPRKEESGLVCLQSDPATIITAAAKVFPQYLHRVGSSSEAISKSTASGSLSENKSQPLPIDSSDRNSSSSEAKSGREIRAKRPSKDWLERFVDGGVGAAEDRRASADEVVESEDEVIVVAEKPPPKTYERRRAESATAAATAAPTAPSWRRQVAKSESGASSTWRQQTLFEVGAVKTTEDSKVLDRLPDRPGLDQNVLDRMLAAAGQSEKLYGGRMTEAKVNRVTTVTEEALDNLQKCLARMPDQSVQLKDPPGLRISLFPHQRHAMAWLAWREMQDPPSGILADDMGLGKTLTMIAHVLKSKEIDDDLDEDKKKDDDDEKNVFQEKNDNDDKENCGNKKSLKLGPKSGGLLLSRATLIVCPASLLYQWKKEIERRCSDRLGLKTLLYHGPQRPASPGEVVDNDFVITTYTLMSSEGKLPGDDAKRKWHESKAEDRPAADVDASHFVRSPLFRVGWRRVVLDEAHVIKNHKSQTSKSACRLRAKYRWALTGTPIQNQLLDMFALIRFLRVSPFDEFKLWKRQVESAHSGVQRLQVLVQTLLLRRAKTDLGLDGKAVVDLPTKTAETHLLDLGPDERRVYDKIFAQTKNVFLNFLENRAAGQSKTPSVGRPAAEADNDDSKRPTQSHILVLLLRLRQACSHLSLLKSSVSSKEDREAATEEGIDFELESMMENLKTRDDDEDDDVNSTSHSSRASTSTKLKIDGETNSKIFRSDFLGTKVIALKEALRLIISEKSDEKVVLVSQWTSMLDVLAKHLDKMRIHYLTIKGDTTPRRRGEIVDEINSPSSSSPRVLLLSLRAGGLGLNLVGANHLFLLDSHWNPALEAQAVDRVYRLGQTRDVYVHKFLCRGTIEERILQMQTSKLKLADDILHGKEAEGAFVAAHNKLSLEDLMLLFDVPRKSQHSN